MQPKLLSNAWPFLFVALAGCQEASVVGAPPAHSTAEPSLASATPPSDPLAPAPAPPVALDTDPPWRKAVREERYREAKDLLEALPDAEKTAATMRFLRAKVATRTRDFALVGPLLDGIVLPMFDEEVQRLRAEAALEVGPYADAIAYYEKSGRPRDLVKAANAADKAKEPKRALALADRALKESQRLKRVSDERLAHGVRSQILVAQGKVDEALTDLKWLATRAPASTEGRTARKTL